MFMDLEKIARSVRNFFLDFDFFMIDLQKDSKSKHFGANFMKIEASVQKLLKN